MTSLWRVKAAMVSGAAVFWIAIIVVYLQQRGLSLPQIYLLISVYYGAVVILEFPTGVIGDHFSNRVVCCLGYLLAAGMFIGFGFAGSFTYYLGLLIAGAVGATLISGNDVATLHATSANFRNDKSQVDLWVAFVQVGTTALGSLLMQIQLGLPFFVNGLFLLAAAVFMLSAPVSSLPRPAGNPLETAWRALRYAAGHPRIRRILALIGLIGTFFLSVKWFFNPVLEGLQVPLSAWGTIIGLTLGLPLIGIWLYRRHQSRPPLLWQAVLGFSLAVSLLGLTTIGMWPLAALALIMILYGYLETTLHIELNDAIQAHERASILSFASLVQRLGTSIYTPIAGVVLAASSMNNLMVGTALALLLTSLPLAIRILHHPKA
jgi:MFS family permease